MLFMLLFGCVVAVLSASVSYSEENIFHWETTFVRWELDKTGHTNSLLDKHHKATISAPSQPTSFCTLTKGGILHSVDSIECENDVLKVSFKDCGVIATLAIKTKPQYLTLSVVSLSDSDVDEFTFLDIPLLLNGLLEEPFSACALALNLQTRIDEIPGPSKRLRATAYKRFGIPGASVAIIATPTPLLRDTLKIVVSEAEDLPKHRDPAYPPIGGPWAMDAPINYGSYLFDFGSLTEETVDAWIDLLHRLGFNQVDFHTGTSLRFGDYTPNPKLFPRGRDSIRTVIDRLHTAGIAAGLHTYAFFIAKDSPYVTPEPDPRLGKDATYTLAASIDSMANVIPVLESTANVSLITGFFARNSVTLQIDNELIIFSDVFREAPYGFLGCTRGAHGTRPSDHAAGTPVFKLKECFGLFTPDGDSTLLTEIAANTANTFNECGFDMIYLDALDGEGILGGNEYGWHYGAKFVYEIANRLNRPALFEMSTFHHHLWCVRARMGAWDHPARGHKRFIDVHCAANREGAFMMLPMNLGWWAVKNWQDGVASVWSEPTYPDDIEYLLCKALGHNMSLSLMGVNPDNIGTMPLFQRLAPLFNRYETLRRSGTVPDTIKAQLCIPGREFTLEGSEEGVAQFRPIAVHKHKVDSSEPWHAQWTVTNPYDRQQPRIRIEALMGVVHYDSPEAILVEDFVDPTAFDLHQMSEGVTADLEPIADPALDKVVARFTATSNRNQLAGSWAQVGKTAKPPLNLSTRPALGLWVEGDNSGAIINLQVLSAAHTGAGGIGDHYITLDFLGKRYFALVEFESERIADMGWPYGHPYHTYREHVDFSSVESFSLWCSHIPPGGTVRCLLSPIKALPLKETSVQNPVLTVNGHTIQFPADIPSGAYLEWDSGIGMGIVYGKKGEELTRVTPVGETPVFEPGDNSIRFSCLENPEAPPRARVTFFTQGELLRIVRNSSPPVQIVQKCL